MVVLREDRAAESTLICRKSWRVPERRLAKMDHEPVASYRDITTCAYVAVRIVRVRKSESLKLAPRRTRGSLAPVHSSHVTKNGKTYPESIVLAGKFVSSSSKAFDTAQLSPV